VQHWKHEKNEEKDRQLRKDITKFGNELTEAMEQKTAAFSVAIQAWAHREPNKVNDEDRAPLVVCGWEKGSRERAPIFIAAWCVH
jgi:hypothetical protein